MSTSAQIGKIHFVLSKINSIESLIDRLHNARTCSTILKYYEFFFHQCEMMVTAFMV